MLESPGNKTDSGPRHHGGPAGNAGSRRRRPGVSQVRRGRQPHRGRRPPAGRPRQWLGTRSGRLGIGFVAGGAAAGLLVTLLAGRGPGAMLGIFLLAGTAAGVLAVRPRAAYLLIPVPPLAYVVAASLAGLVHDRAADASHAALAISAARWIASGFPAMTAATLLAIGVATAGWVAARRRPGLNHLEFAGRAAGPLIPRRHPPCADRTARGPQSPSSVIVPGREDFALGHHDHRVGGRHVIPCSLPARQ